MTWTGCIYIAENTKSGTCYIGKSINGMSRRRKSHLQAALRGENTKFYAAIRSYGPDAFRWTQIFFCDDEAALTSVEIETIASYKLNGVKLYNMTNGGDGISGLKFSPESIERLRQSHRGQKPSPETLKKRSLALRGRKMSDAEREKRSLAQKGRTFTEAHRQKIAEALRGKTLPEEVRRKLSDAGKGRKMTPDAIAKSVEARRGYVHSEETRAKMREAASKRRRRPHSEETRRKISAGLKARFGARQA